MNTSSAVLIGVGVVGVGVAGYAAYQYVNRAPSAGRTMPGPYQPYQGQPGYAAPPNTTQPGNPGNQNAAPPPKPPPSEAEQAARDAAAWLAVARSGYGLVQDIVGDIGDAVADF